jgi:PKD repeat protein
VASFTHSPADPYAQETITFDATASYDPDGNLVSYQWDFGDSNVTTVTTPIITHAYLDCGNYTVTLTVTDNEGLASSASQTITVINPAHLRLWADVGSYVDSHPDEWTKESWVASSNMPPGGSVSFNLYIDAVSTPDGADPTYDVYLAVAVNDTAQVASITIGPTTITTFTYGEVTWPDAAGDGTLPPHGVYPTWYTLVPFGDVASNHGYHTTPGDPYGPYWAFRSCIPVTITASATMIGGFKVHFDAQGVLVRGSTYPGDRNNNPYSHDSTFISTYTPPVVTAEVTFDQVGVDTDFTETVLTVDSTGYGVDALPKTFTWLVSSEHTFEYHSPLVVDTGKRYVWTQTTGLSTAQSGTITIPSGGGTVTGYYKTQYQITVTASPTEALGGTFKVTYTQCGIPYTNVQKITLWPEWVDATTIVTVSEPQDIINVAPDTRYKFDSYNPSPSVTMDNTKTITLVYKTQYYLTVISPHGTPGGEGWYEKDTTAYGTVTPLTVPGPTGAQYVFTHWGGDASGITSPSNPITMDAPKTAIANWKAQYYLTVRTDPPGIVTIPGEGWYDASFGVSLTAPSVSGYVFQQWDVDGISQGVDIKNIIVPMGTPHTATAHYKTIPVGGIWTPTNKLKLLAPYILSTSSILTLYIAVVAYVKHWERSKNSRSKHPKKQLNV